MMPSPEQTEISETVAATKPSQTALFPPKRRKRLTTGQLLLLALVVVFGWLLAVTLLAADRYAAVVTVVGQAGAIAVNPAANYLDFGELPPNHGASRFITLTVNTDCRFCFKAGDRRIIVFTTGRIAELMKTDQPNRVVHPGESQRIEFNVYVPPSAPAGSYRGTVWILKLPKLF